MNLEQIVNRARDKHNFRALADYFEFCQIYLNYIQDNLQAVIVSQNENHYQFYQYGEEGNFQITRPINSNLMLNAPLFELAVIEFLDILNSARSRTIDSRGKMLNCAVYTIQQSIGAALDALPVGYSNTARKINGDLFERFIRLIIQELGLDCKTGVVQVPVLVEDKEVFKMAYQHDLIVTQEGKVRILGSVKTSSKDRLGKIFVDKFLYNRLTSTSIPHIAVFLNDVQRKKARQENQYGVNSTFLPGHFKAFAVKLNPLDGVYYCDIRPNMITEDILKDHIKTFDRLILEDIWTFLS